MTCDLRVLTDEKEWLRKDLGAGGDRSEAQRDGQQKQPGSKESYASEGGLAVPTPATRSRTHR